MKLRKFFFVYTTFVVCFTNILLAQSDYRSKENEHYWKNNVNADCYWQQDVHYSIEAKIDENTDILTGKLSLIYWNNSPDELNFLYFHLYQNAYQPNSYLAEMAKDFPYEYSFGNYEQKGLNIQVEKVFCEGKMLKTELDNTILKVYLIKPLKKGESVTLNLNFTTYFDIGASWRRMSVYNSWGQKHYNGGHWYPRVSVYDRKFGWTADQHLGHEFYGDFGSYDVTLDFPANYIVEATGELQNENEVMPKELREKLDIKNFVNKPLYEKPSVIIPYESTKRKQWKFKAINVHDFAFLADPNFRIGEVNWNGIKCIALANESVASRWQDAAELTAFFVKVYSELIGPYHYPKMIVSDARSGMEYPMLTMDGGLSPDYAFVFAHEIAHNWFFGMVGNNETYQATLDEGFTQFLTVLALEELSKAKAIESEPKSKYVKQYTKKFSPTEQYVFRSYIENAAKTEGVSLNTHSDMFFTNQPYGSEYRQTYSKGAVMLFNLQYVLGDSLFKKAMQNYFQEWKFRHPYFEDFRNSIIHYTKVDLNWFFDQWLETNKFVDYAFVRIKAKKEPNNYEVYFKRKGSMQMPIDFAATLNNDSIVNYHIPNTNFVKKTNATVLPKWYGWNNFNRTYKATISSELPIKKIEIDPSYRLADINLLNNTKPMPMNIAFDSKVYNQFDRQNYEILARPDIWWNSYDGIKAGFYIEGAYLQYFNQFSANLWINTGAFQNIHQSERYHNGFDNISYVVNYSHPLQRSSYPTWLKLQMKHLDGLDLYKALLYKSIFNGRADVYTGVKSMFRKDSSDLIYLLYPNHWDVGSTNSGIRYNNTAFWGANYYFGKKKLAKLNMELISSALYSSYDYSKVTSAFTNQQNIHKLLLRYRLFATYAFGSYLPKESALYLAGASPESLMDSKFTRSKGYIDNTFLNYGINTNHFQMGGGLNLRGYAGYLVAEDDTSGNLSLLYMGHSGASINAELEFSDYINLKLHPTISKTIGVKSYLFGDLGIISKNAIDDELVLSKFRADAGLGLLFTLKSFGDLQKLKPFSVRVDFPLFLNRIPAEQEKYFAFRWLVGINRAF